MQHIVRALAHNALSSAYWLSSKVIVADYVELTKELKGLAFSTGPDYCPLHVTKRCQIPALV